MKEKSCENDNIILFKPKMKCPACETLRFLKKDQVKVIKKCNSMHEMIDVLSKLIREGS